MQFLYDVSLIYATLCFIGIIFYVFRKELFIIEKQRPIYYLLIMLGSLYLLFLFFLQVFRQFYAHIPGYNFAKADGRDVDILPIMISLVTTLYCFNLIAEINKKQRESQKLKNQRK